MEFDNKKSIMIISFLKKIIYIFFSLFFNIYILKIVNNDLNFILKYTIYSVAFGVIIQYVVLNKINSKNAIIIYRMSFLLLSLCIIILLVFKEKIVNYIYLFKTLHTLAAFCYSTPYELMVIDSSTNKNMSNFLANMQILENIAVILTPIFSGFIIEKLSYMIFFVMLILETLIIIIISLRIKNIALSDKKMNMKKYLDKIKNKPHLNNIYKCMFYRRISIQGAITELLPIVLFLRLGREFTFGTYNSVFAIISILSLQILKYINKKNIKKRFYPYLAIVIFIVSIFVVFNTSFVLLIIYYILMNSLGSIIESEFRSCVYSSIKVDGLEKYKKEHIMIFNIYMAIGQCISYFVVFVLYNYFYNVNILSIAISVLMFFLVIATFYLNKTQSYIQNK